MNENDDRQLDELSKCIFTDSYQELFDLLHDMTGQAFTESEMQDIITCCYSFHYKPFNQNTRMKRKIKFRAKDFYGNWQIGLLCQDANGRYCIQKWSDGNNELKLKTKSDIPVDENTIGQFTGLRCKNGKEIYDGDIVEFTQHKLYNLGGFKAKVVYDNERACFGYLKEKPLIANLINPFAQTDELKHDLLKHMTVIGNIYENSDLLSQL